MIPITLRELTKSYGRTVAVDHVNLKIEQGELFFLLGPSGCGKTTLLRMIAGLIDPTSGQILFGDKDVTQVPTGRRNTAMVFQSYALWPHMSVGENVAFGLDVRKLSSAQKRDQVRQALAVVRMEELTNRRPAQLSGGQQQRVALARALAVRPDVLLLDEPLSNLDAKLRLEMREEICRICNETDVTAVYVTHDQEEALSMADRIAVMHLGKLWQVGSPREIYDHPETRFVADFLGQANFLSGTVRECQAGTVVLETPLGCLRSSHVPDGLAAGAEVTCSIRPESLRLLENGIAADNEFTGRLVQTVYQGHMAQHIFETGDSVKLKINELKPSPHPTGEDTLKIGIDAADVVVLQG